MGLVCVSYDLSLPQQCLLMEADLGCVIFSPYHIQVVNRVLLTSSFQLVAPEVG
jgi:hypothetical protein